MLTIKQIEKVNRLMNQTDEHSPPMSPAIKPPAMKTFYCTNDDSTCADLCLPVLAVSAEAAAIQFAETQKTLSGHIRRTQIVYVHDGDVMRMLGVTVEYNPTFNVVEFQNPKGILSEVR